MIKKSLTLRVLVVSFLLLALPLLIDSFIFFQNSYYDAVIDAKRDLKVAATTRSFNLLGVLPVTQVVLSELIFMMNLEEKLESKLDIAEMNRKLMEVVHEGGEFQIFIMEFYKDHHYKIIASSRESSVGTYFTSFRFSRDIMKEGEATLFRYNYDANKKKYVPSIFIAQMIKSKSGKPLGIIMAAANIETQTLSLIEKTSAPRNILFALLNSDSIVVSATDPQLIGQYFDPISPQRLQEILSTPGLEPLTAHPLPVIKNNDPSFFEFIFNDQVQIAYRAKHLAGGIQLISYSPKESLFGPAVRHFLLLYTIYGLILIIGGGITYWISGWISRPLRQLSHLMIDVSKGKLNARFQEERFGFEINILGNLFNHTLDNLLEHIQHAEDERVKKETYQREIAIIRQVQSSLLFNTLPVVKGVELAARYLPAGDVGGDYYDYLLKKTQSGEETLIITVSDTAGRGITSSLYALSLRGLFRTYATLADDLGAILNATNLAFVQDAADTGMFVTIFAGMYHVDSKIFSFCSCGHIPCFIKRKNGETITLASSAIAIGLKESTRYSANSIQLFPGDTVFLYTEALITSLNEQKEPFTESRLKTLCQTRDQRTAQELVDDIAADVQKHIHLQPQEEEIIIVALKVTN